MDRPDHLNWCKQRALEYIELGDLEGSLTSMFSDLGKHPETREHPGIVLGGMMLVGGLLNSPEEVRKFIEGFN